MLYKKKNKIKLGELFYEKLICYLKTGKQTVFLIYRAISFYKWPIFITTTKILSSNLG